MRYLSAISIFLLSSCGLMDLPEDCEPNRAELTAWLKAEREGTPGSYQAFLSSYPNGCFARKAGSSLRREIQQARIARVSGASQFNTPSTTY